MFLKNPGPDRDPAATADVWTSDRRVLSAETFAPLSAGEQGLKVDICDWHIIVVID